MKYKLAGISTMMLMIVCVGLVAQMEQGGESGRYHQHLSAEIPEEACDRIGGGMSFAPIFLLFASIRENRKFPAT